MSQLRKVVFCKINGDFILFEWVKTDKIDFFERVHFKIVPIHKIIIPFYIRN
jgi:hypothetical protein